MNSLYEVVVHDDGIRSLNDLLVVFAWDYVYLGILLKHVSMVLAIKADAALPLDDTERQKIAALLPRIEERCSELELPVSSKCVKYWKEQFSTGHPETYIQAHAALGEMERTITHELSEVFFFYVPKERQHEAVKMHAALKELDVKPWPIACVNLHHARGCYLTHQFTASVFHSMRAAEKCLTTLAESLGIDSKREQWQSIIERIESAVKDLDRLPRGEDREKRQCFYSEAAMQLRYIKNAWRNHVMHARAVYDDPQAREIWWHVKELVAACSSELSEATEV